MSELIVERPTDDSPDWAVFFKHTVQPFWDAEVKSFQLTGKDNCPLHAVLCVPPGSKTLVIVSPGRIEAAIKYQEFVWELAQQNIAVAILDHRGQGQSGRLTANPHQGHVEDFDDFVSDFALFYDHISEELPNHQQILFAHSMGGAIASLFLARADTHKKPHKIKAALLSSPMFSIRTVIPERLAKVIVAAGFRLNNWLAKQRPWYFFGMRDYLSIEFEKNDLTHSQTRYKAFRQVYDDHPEVQLGGPTFTWLYQALRASAAATDLAQDIEIPVVVVQAGGDQVVTSRGQEDFVAQLPHPDSKLVVIPDSRHELVMEADLYRAPLMQELMALIQVESRK